MGEFLMNAQGEDVVAGERTPMPIAKMAEVMPKVFKQFQKICDTLEEHYRDMQDMEFTIENHGGNKVSPPCLRTKSHSRPDPK